MADTPRKSTLRDALEADLTDELKKLKKDNPETQKPYTLTDKSKVWDRILKLEAIKAKLNEGEWGKGFGGDDE